ncbi:large-conductance mechanosensitive channel [Catellatospora sp. TT07R-123]|uniref:large conductance mechanosensitive channel protein MscL n=1 Tax=Catellatospora sp. TT07R-123 TaxID=2733863 RepID=UPI001B06C70E|nr:large conductance mechanosensitive channel protein MscL [Catellatospora sp. TT07R-123]GHJ48445.1 large-conductance mechanosensitive channel [Catellatospora sp. TT07R-123]
MLNGFKNFVMRGNVVDLAVGVVIGAAFTTLVTQFTASFLQPLIKMIGAGGAVSGLKFTIPGDQNAIDLGSFINALITFVLTAAVLYFLVVLPMNRLAERRDQGKEPEPKPITEDVRLLTEIRDALVAGRVPAQAVRAETGSAAEPVAER